MTTKYTVVQHSGYGYGGKQDFARGLETRSLQTAAQVRKVEKAGGLVFDNYGAAEDYVEDEKNVGPGLYPMATGTFSRAMIDGLRIYIPPETESFVVNLPVRVYADSAELARDHLATISGKGEVRLTAGEDAVIVAEAYEPEVREVEEV